MKIRPALAAVVAIALLPMLPLDVFASEQSLSNASDADASQGLPAVMKDGAAPRAFAFNSTATFATAYLFQGIDYSEGESVVQPQVGVAYGNLSASVWLNHDLNYSHTNEYDVTFQYAWSAAPFNVTGGYVYLTYPHREGWDASQEMLLDFDVESFLAPSISIHYDFDAGHGVYSTFGLAHAFALPMQPVTVGGSVYYQSHYYKATGFPACELNVSAERAAGPFTITPSLSRVVTWENGDFRGEAAVANTWLFSIGLAQSF